MLLCWSLQTDAAHVWHSCKGGYFLATISPSIAAAVLACGCTLPYCPWHCCLLVQVCPGAAVAMSSQQHMALFSAALRASGPGEASASAAGCAAALLDAGLVGCGAHLRRQPAITHRPPFSEYR